LTSDVTDELFWDPKVDNAAIAVSADGGVITLRGTVGSFREKRDARKDAERVYGVTSVINELEVRLLDKHRREDTDLRGDVLQAFALDYLIPSTVDVKAKDGFVTLKGTVEWQYQREEADFVAANILGVIDVFDEMTLKAKPKVKAVKDDIRSAFKRNAALDADGLTVTTSNGTVKLKGAVNSWAEHDEAVSAAWAAPGVTNVDDRILVEY
jgi:osmotically-inducible protein OsmY